MGLILLSFAAFLIFGGMFFSYWYYNTDNVGEMFFKRLDWLDYSLILSQLFTGTIIYTLSWLDGYVILFGEYISGVYPFLIVILSAYISILLIKIRYKIKLSIYYDRNFVTFFTAMMMFLELTLSLLLIKLF